MDRNDEEFLKRLHETFKVEAQEHLSVISSGLLEIEKSEIGKRDVIIETVYREAHSLKGAARSVDLPDIVSICRSIEDVFSALKRKLINTSPEILDLLHHAVDRTSRLVRGEEFTRSEKTGVKELIRSLERQVKKQGNVFSEAATTELGKGLIEEVKEFADVGSTQRATAPTPTGTVRISAAKLDTLLLKAEEMLSIKLATGQRAADLRGLRSTFCAWKKEKAKGEGHLTETYKQESEVVPLISSLEGTLDRLVKSAESDQRTFGIMVDALLDDVKQALMLPVSTLLESFPGLVRNLSRDAGKEVHLTVDGGDIEVDRRILEELKDPLIHLVRNCIDHGIEQPDAREKKKKPPLGNIKIEVSSRDGKIEIAVSDDGAGIDALEVKSLAESNGAISREEAGRLSDREALLLVFRSGVTTSPIITDISGRGLGLAIVSEKAAKLNGTVSIESLPDTGTTIKIIVPLTLVTFRGVFVRISEHLFVLPSANAERVARVKKEEIRTVENRETITIAGQAVSLVNLADVLGIKTKPGMSADISSVVVIVLSSAEKRVAFLIDEMLHEQEVLVKPLGKQLSRVRHLAGATVLGNGRIVPILNVSDLVKSAISAIPSGVVVVDEVTVPKKAILVAEDSITARTLLKTILESAGYAIKTAVDGLDAITTLRAGNFDLVVSDVDMPRLNGFDLTAKIRSDRKLSELPVILVTALESREDKERGVDVGANAYIVKSSFDQSNLLEVIRRLI